MRKVCDIPYDDSRDPIARMRVYQLARKRSSGRDRARIFEYALGSARESIEWYDASGHLLEQELLQDRKEVLSEISRMLLAIIPRERDRTIRPSK